jgi:xanthine dehydrogenase YagR molybdenum-binding subunit
VQAACHAVREKLFGYARKMDDSPLANASLDHVAFADGRIVLTSNPSRAVTFNEAMLAGGVERIEEAGKGAVPGWSPCWSPARRFPATRTPPCSPRSRSTEELGIVRVTRIVNAVAAGRILNPKTARSQIIGGVVFGIGMALEEETVADHLLGRFMTHHLADYHVPVHADVHDIDVIFVEEHDGKIKPLGVKGVGEIGVVGTAAASANAVYHATGVRVRELPITVDKLVQHGL